jgi:hypothetical protein
VTAAAVLATFAVFAALMYRRVLPAILAVPSMAVVMLLVVGTPLAQVGATVVSGAASLAPVYVTVIFGALLARVTLDSGIARALVNLAAEYGGERPAVLALVLCAVVSLLFTSLSGLGAVIMVGSIVLPIMMTTGVPRTLAATLFLLAFALGFIFNPTNWKFYTQLFGVAPEQLMRYALVLAIVDAAALVLFAAIGFARERGYATWAARGDDRDAPLGVPGIALLTPLIPLALYFALRLDPTIAFIVAAVFGALVTAPRRAIATLTAAAIRGVEDVAPAVLLFIGIGMLLAATKVPQLAAALQPLVAGGWIANPVAYVVLFGVASPLTLYRGPLNPFGVGIAVFTVLLASHVLPPVIIVAAVMAVVQVQNVCDPTNTANVWVANFTGVPIDTISRRTLPFQTAVAIVACVVVVTASQWLFGVAPFTALVPPARADAFPGLYAEPSTSGVLAVDNDGSAFARAAADALLASQPPIRAIALHDDPGARDCTGKRYAAYLYVTSSVFRIIEGADLDIGMRLQDCGGWIASEWHEHRVVRAPGAADARALGIANFERVRRWLVDDAHGQALLARGLAAIPGDRPSYYYTLFKTVDGNMRAFVRAGGPAYDAGLRTGDIITKIDGRFWWEYGTYQTQARAYDGKPHSFEVQRGTSTLDIQLLTPFVPV